MNHKPNRLITFPCREGGKNSASPPQNGEGFVALKSFTYPLIRQGFKSLANNSSPLKRTKCFLYNDVSPLSVDLIY